MEKTMPSKCQWMATNRIKVRVPFNSLFPVDQNTVDAVAEHMEANGYDQSQPIILWKEKLDEDKHQAIIIDGHTRLLAAKKIGLSPVYVARVSFSDQESALRYAIHNQRDRRNLTDADLIRCIEAVDKRKPRGGDRKSEAVKSKSATQPFDSAQETAQVVGTSRDKVKKARTVLDHADEDTKQAVLEGKKSIHAAAGETQEKRGAEPANASKGLKKVSRGWRGYQCRVAFKAHADALFWKQEGKKSVRKILSQLSKESGIPFKILKQWWEEEEAEKKQRWEETHPTTHDHAQGHT